MALTFKVNLGGVRYARKLELDGVFKVTGTPIAVNTDAKTKEDNYSVRLNVDVDGNKMYHNVYIAFEKKETTFDDGSTGNNDKQLRMLDNMLQAIGISKEKDTFSLSQNTFDGKEFVMIKQTKEFNGREYQDVKFNVLDQYENELKLYNDAVKKLSIDASANDEFAGIDDVNSFLDDELVDEPKEEQEEIQEEVKEEVKTKKVAKKPTKKEVAELAKEEVAKEVTKEEVEELDGHDLEEVDDLDDLFADFELEDEE